jgi:hypothetical protein
MMVPTGRAQSSLPSPSDGPAMPRRHARPWKGAVEAGRRARNTPARRARHTAATVLLALQVPERTVMGVNGLVVDVDGRALPARNRSHPA